MSSLCLLFQSLPTISLFHLPATNHTIPFSSTDDSIQNRAAYFAKELHNSMAGMGTNDRALIRLVVSRCEIDMGNIKQEYQKIYGKPLEKAIKVGACLVPLVFYFLVPFLVADCLSFLHLFLTQTFPSDSYPFFQCPKLCFTSMFLLTFLILCVVFLFSSCFYFLSVPQSLDIFFPFLICS